MTGIYKITSPSKKIYIGQSVDIEIRFKRYKNLHCKKQIRLYNSFLKYGVDKHKFEILCECNVEELNDKERYYQDVFSSIGKTGLNCFLTKSSDRSGKHSEETRKKMSLNSSRYWTGKTFSEESRKKMSESRKGQKRSEEHCKKLSLAHKGRQRSEEHKRKLLEVHKGNKWALGKKMTEDNRLKLIEKNIGNKWGELGAKLILNTETGIFYYGNRDASKTIGITHSNLARQLNGGRKNKTSFIYV